MPDDPDTLSAAKLLAHIKQLTAGEIHQLAAAAREVDAAGLGPAVGLAGLDAELKAIPCRRAGLLDEAYAAAEDALAVACQPAGASQDHPAYLGARRAVRNAAAALTMWDLIRPDSTRLLLYGWLRLTRPDLQPAVPAEDYDENRQAWKDILRAAREQDEARQPPGPRVLAPWRLRDLTADAHLAGDRQTITDPEREAMEMTKKRTKHQAPQNR